MLISKSDIHPLDKIKYRNYNNDRRRLRRLKAYDASPQLAQTVLRRLYERLTGYRNK